MEERKKQLEAVKAAKSESAVGLLNPNLAGYEAAMNVSPIYAGLYRMKLSLWGFQWNAGKPEPGPDQAAVLRAHEEGKQQEGGRLLRAFTAPSMKSNEAEIIEFLVLRRGHAPPRGAARWTKRGPWPRGPWPPCAAPP